MRNIHTLTAALSYIQRTAENDYATSIKALSMRRVHYMREAPRFRLLPSRTNGLALGEGILLGSRAECSRRTRGGNT